MVKKLRVSLALQPVGDRAVRQFAVHRGQAERLSLLPLARSGATPTHRTGMLPWAFETGMGFERWVDYALDVPMYFVKRGDSYIDVAGKSFRDFMAGKLAGAAGRACRRFPTGPIISARFSPRCGSSGISRCAAPMAGPWRRLPSLPAFWVGILYDDDCARCGLGPGEGLDRGGTAEAARRRAEAGFQGGNPRPQRARAGARNVAAGSQGLARRKRLDRNGRDETRYLRPLEESIERGITPAEELLREFHGDWGGSVDPILR